MRLGIGFKSLIGNIGKRTKRIRIANWGILIICFFLPFSRGCIHIIETPCKDAFKGFDYFVFAGLPFLYPLLFLLVAYIFYLIRNERRKNVVATVLYFICFYAITLAVIFAINTLYSNCLKYGFVSDADNNIAVCLVILWAIMAFGCKKLSAKNILSMIAFQSSTIAGAWIIFIFYTSEERLIGAWLASIASVCIFIAYIFDYLKGRHCMAPPSISIVETNE